MLCFTRPRYQVSVYRTNGPMVFSLVQLLSGIFWEIAAHSVGHMFSLFFDYL